MFRILALFCLCWCRLIVALTEEVKSVSVTEGDTVTLHTDATQIYTDDNIIWKYENTLIAQMKRGKQTFSTFDGPDGRFRDRLKLDHQTGSLTITNTTTEHTGQYELQIIGAELKSKIFSVSVNNSAHGCGSTEAVSRLVLSVLVGVATVGVYDIISR